jgi:excisionase family DNA binding protein
MQTVQFISVTPEQLQNAIIEGVKTQLEDLKKHWQPKTPTELLTRQEVATLFKVDISTIHNWTKRGEIQSYSVGSRVYYKRSEIENSLIKLSK